MWFPLSFTMQLCQVSQALHSLLMILFLTQALVSFPQLTHNLFPLLDLTRLLLTTFVFVLNLAITSRLFLKCGLQLVQKAILARLITLSVRSTLF